METNAFGFTGDCPEFLLEAVAQICIGYYDEIFAVLITISLKYVFEVINENIFLNKSMWCHLMAWCHQTTSH